MEIPETFKPKKLEEMDLNNLKSSKKKKHKYSIKELIPDEMNFRYKKKNLSHVDLEKLGVDFVVESKHLEKIIVVNYESIERIIFFQYKTQNHLNNDLKKVLEKGMRFYNSSHTKFTERFFFGDNIAIYIEGWEEFTRDAGACYKKLGLKQLDFDVKAI